MGRRKISKNKTKEIFSISDGINPKTSKGFRRIARDAGVSETTVRNFLKVRRSVKKEPKASAKKKIEKVAKKGKRLSAEEEEFSGEVLRPEPGLIDERVPLRERLYKLDSEGYKNMRYKDKIGWIMRDANVTEGHAMHIYRSLRGLTGLAREEALKRRIQQELVMQKLEGKYGKRARKWKDDKVFY